MAAMNPLDVVHLSNNRANQITRESICTAMIKLMETKEFDQITISEIVRCAGVSRPSFYRNYDSKEDIIIEIEKGVLQYFEETFRTEELAGNQRLRIYRYFELMEENKLAVMILQKAKLSDRLFPKLSLFVEEYVHRYSPEFHYKVVGTLGAIKAIALDWIAGGMKESCETMADICMHFDLSEDFPQEYLKTDMKEEG